jgi:hypothetical protein
VHRADHTTTSAPALRLGTSSPFKRWTSPAIVRLGARLSGDLLRLDLHPADLDHTRCVGAVEKVLKAARHRVAVTYDELAERTAREPLPQLTRRTA